MDHYIGPKLYDAFKHRFALPTALWDELRDDIFRFGYKASSTKNDKMIIHGTVLSGHPTLTTLFNTIRSLLY